MDPALKRRLIDALAFAMIDNAEELTALDQAIGDGDHGLNMKRGFEAVLHDADAIAAKSLPDAAAAIGRTLVMKVGGASGPLYGTLFMGLGKELSDDPALPEVARALAGAIAAVQSRGKSEPGMKTMLDVLVPVQAALAQAERSDEPSHLAARLPRVADEAAHATVPMLAIRGRASFLGQRSVGHMDPGARSSALLVAAVCGVLAG